MNTPTLTICILYRLKSQLAQQPPSSPIESYILTDIACIISNLILLSSGEVRKRMHMFSLSLSTMEICLPLYHALPRSFSAPTQPNLCFVSAFTLLLFQLSWGSIVATNPSVKSMEDILCTLVVNPSPNSVVHVSLVIPSFLS